MARRRSTYRPSRLRLQDRVALGFALLALVLSLALAGAAWLVVSSYLNHQTEISSVAQTTDNALLLRERLSSGDEPSVRLVNSLHLSPGTAALLVYGDRSYPSRSAVQIELPEDLSVHARHGSEQYRRVDISGRPYLVVGAPLSSKGDALFELYSLTSLQRTLRVLGAAVLFCALLTSLVGLLLGRVASRRLLQPLDEVTEAASAIAKGDLSVRLRTDTDPDLAVLARSFNRTAAALEQRVRADARFAGDVSHELRTPLTTMLNSLALLQNRRSEMPAEVTEPLDLLTEDMQRFRKLVVDLLDISRADGGGEREDEPVSIADLVRRAADTAAGRPVTVVDEAAARLVVPADKRRLERVFANLVENAEVHGGGCVAVHVRARHGWVRVEVDDAGPGIPAERRERIFERFARGGSSDTPGVGLGLAIVGRHVRWHGGRVSVENRSEGGARFVVELPVTRRRRPRAEHDDGSAADQTGGDGTERPPADVIATDGPPALAREVELPAASRRPGSPGRPARR